MRRIVLLLVGVLVGVLVASGLAASPAAAADTSLRGRVVDADGQPLAGVTVDMWLKTSEGRFDALSPMVTNAEGRFYVWTGAFGDAQVRLGFSDDQGRVPPEFYADASDLASATDIDVGTVDVDLGDVELGVASHITGRLTGEDGAPLTNGVAFVYTGVPGSWDLIGRDYTDLTGHYDVGGLGAGTYRIRFVDYDGERFEEVYEDAATLDEGTDIDLVEAETRGGVDAVLATAATIAGRVTDELGAPLRGISVHVHELRDGEWLRRAIDYTTNSAGYYEVYDLRPGGSYRLEFDDRTQHLHRSEFYDDAPDVERATTVEMPAVATRVWVGDVQLAEAVRLSGTVSDPAGGPVAGLVTAYRQVDGVRVEVASDATDHLGHYDLRGLRAGSYDVGFDAAADDLVDAVRPVTLGDQELRDGFDVQLAEAPFVLVDAPTLTLYGDPTAENSYSTIGLNGSSWSSHPGTRTTTWLRDGVEVPGDGTTYVLGVADRGHTISAREDVVSRFGQEVSTTSQGVAIPAAPAPLPTPAPPPTTAPPTTAPVPAPVPPPTVAPVLVPEVEPVLRGRQRPDGVLRVTRGSWPADGLSWDYRWYADGDRIRGARDRSLRVRPRLAGARLSVRVVVRADDMAPWRGRLRFPRRG